jgi:pimeloyl-ACP methyl ester carboxylesterase
MPSIEPVRIEADGVPGLLFAPRGDEPLPLVLLGHGAHTGKDDEHMQILCRSFARGLPAAVLVIDCPGHGERRPESDADYLAGVERNMADASVHHQLAQEWTTMAAAVRSSEPRIDDRTAYVGFSMGSIFGASIVQDLPFVGPVVLALGGFVGPSRIPGTNDLIEAGLRALGDREVLMVSMTRDESFPFADALRAFELIPGPKRMFVYEGGHIDIPGEAVRLAGQFLQRTLAR